jgi:hypothetical protein
VYYFSEAARKAVFTDKIATFLRTVFEKDVLAFQSFLLEQEAGQESLHDPASAAVSWSFEFIASWIALEDVADDAGSVTCRKGDTLLWRANLAEGGSKVACVQTASPRRRLATHYCPYDMAPSYFELTPAHGAKIRWRDGCYYSSARYLPSDQMTSLVSQSDRIEATLWWALRKAKPVVKPFIPTPLLKLFRHFVSRDTV